MFTGFNNFNMETAMFNRKIIITFSIALTVIVLWIFRVELLDMMRWFADLKAVTADIQHIGILGTRHLVRVVCVSGFSGIHPRAGFDGGVRLPLRLLERLPAFVAQSGCRR